MTKYIDITPTITVMAEAEGETKQASMAEFVGQVLRRSPMSGRDMRKAKKLLEALKQADETKATFLPVDAADYQHIKLAMENVQMAAYNEEFVVLLDAIDNASDNAPASEKAVAHEPESTTPDTAPTV